jgi:hypothetical protein
MPLLQEELFWPVALHLVAISTRPFVEGVHL